MARVVDARNDSSFNLIHSGTGTKVDLFALGDDELDVRQLARREQIVVDEGVNLGRCR